MTNAGIGVKGWRNYSTFSLFAAGSARADKNTQMLVDTSSGNFTVLATDWNLGARIPCSLTRAYNHQDSTSGVDRPFGPGWYWQFDMNLTGSLDGSDDVTWKAADGSEYDYTYSGGDYTPPAGMHDTELIWSSDHYELRVGKITYHFYPNSDDSRCRLTSIRDFFGNGLELSRPTDGNGDPEATISYIQIRYYNGSSWTTHDLVEPTYSSGLITQLRLLDTLDGSDYLDIHYSYGTIDSSDRLTKAEPKFGTTALNMEVEYDYNTSSGLEMEKVYDTNGSKAGTPYYWTVNYTSGNVSSIVFPIASGDTGTVSYTCNTSEPTSWSHADPNAWNKVTDANSNDWYYGQDSSGRVEFAVDPLWVNSTHESYTEYAYNSDNQVTSAKVPKPNSESGQLTTSYYYDSNKHLAAVVDHYGFVSWYVYGTRASYSTSGTGATIYDVIGVFTPMPNEKAYSDSDHTSSETTAPSLSSPATVSSHVSWDTTNLYWKYSDGSGTPKTIKLVRSVTDYTYATGTGQLTTLLTCSPENFGESSATTYTLTTDSGCNKQEFDSTVGGLSKTYTPRQFKDSSTYKWTAYTHSQTYGVLTEMENADSVLASAGKKTKFTYNDTNTRQTKVESAQDNANQYVINEYNVQEFLLGSRRPDIASWGVEPQQYVNEYDYNGNMTKVYQADPDSTDGGRWDGNSGVGYDELRGASYDRINRVTDSYVKVDWDQDDTVETLTTYFTLDDNGNVTRIKGPAYADGHDTKYTYNFTDYDEMNRPEKVYNTTASTNADLTTKPSEYTEYDYDLPGNTKKVKQPLYDGGTSTTNYATIYTFDWQMRQIKASQGWTNYSSSADNRVTEQHYDSSGGTYWSQDGEGYKHYPEKDLNGRLSKIHRGSSTGDNDERVYDDNGNLLYYYTFKDVETDSSNYRIKNKYDEMDRLVNGGREQYTGGSWQNWNEKTADSTFNYNGAPLKNYDKVNSGKYAERVYDNWGQLVNAKAPAVPNPAGGGDITYETENTYDVLGRVTQVDDHMDNSTNYTYDLLGRLIEVIDAELNNTKTYHDERGNRYHVDKPNGSDDYYFYNDRNLLSTYRSSHDSTTDDTDYTYNDNNWMTQIDYPDSGVTKLEYDELGRKDTQQVLLSGTDYLDTTYQYDDDNRMTKMTIPGSYHYDYTYDDLGNMTKMEDTNSDDTDMTYDKDNRLSTRTTPNGKVVTNTYDWKTGMISSVQNEINATAADDITLSYTYDDNGRPTTITDGRSNAWTKAYDAMGRITSLTTPDPGAGAYTHTITYDGNSNITKTDDFKGTVHYYQYDGLNRMTGHGTDSGADDETYTWACCGQVTAFSDGTNTASLTYDDLGRLTSFTDTQGNAVTYEYDERSRVTKVTPTQGTNYRTEYSYNKNGSLSQVKTYDSGTGSDTDYSYNTTSGKLSYRDFPTVSSQNIRTTYSYDSAGRLQYETVTRETGSTTNLYRTSYAYSYASYHRQVVRTEQTPLLGGWDNDNRITYKYDGMERLDYEDRDDWTGAAWSDRYDTTQEYDKDGNRTRLHKNVAGGYTADYGAAMDLSYTFNSVNFLTAISDSDDGNYSGTVTCDANGNITEIHEQEASGGNSADLYTYFTLDWANRVTDWKIKAFNFGQNDWQWTKREHTYDPISRLIKSTYKQWWDQEQEPSGDSVEHIYAGSRHLQNTDDGTNFGERWHWAGAQHAHNSPVKSPNADTASTAAFNIANDKTPQRRTFSNPTTEDDQRNLYGQGKVMPKDSSGNGANWGTGIASDDPNGVLNPMNSRLDFDGTVAPTDLDRATDAREKGRIGIFGSALAYAGSSPRVTSETIGRDINPLGRGDGRAYIAGAMKLGRIVPILPLALSNGGTGNSANNEGSLDGDSPDGEAGGAIAGRVCIPDAPCLKEFLARRAAAGNPDCGIMDPLPGLNRYCPCCPESCTSDEWASTPSECSCIECECRKRGCKCSRCVEPIGLQGLCCPNCYCCEISTQPLMLAYIPAVYIKNYGEGKLDETEDPTAKAFHDARYEITQKACAKFLASATAYTYHEMNLTVTDKCFNVQPAQCIHNLCDDSKSLADRIEWKYWSQSNNICAKYKESDAAQQVMMWTGKSGRGCTGATGIQPNPDMNVCVTMFRSGGLGSIDQDLAVYYLIHELIHFCDCNYGVHFHSIPDRETNDLYQRCRAVLPSGVYGTASDPDREFNEGYCEHCTRAVTGESAYELRSESSEDSCCLCTWCGGQR